MNQNYELESMKPAERTHPRAVFTPRTDIFETDTAFHLVADMPGVDPKSLDITLEQDVLTLSGVSEPRAPEGYTAVHAEYGPGEYRRTFRLHEASTDAGRIHATLRDGVLRLSVPKVAPEKKKIPVTVA